MDDQFGGRTDDDLFFDDFEPVADSQPIETVEVAPPPPPAAVATPPVEPPKPEPAPQKHVEQPQQSKSRPAAAPRGGLANSRFADTKPAPAPAPRAPRQQAPAQTAPPAAISNNAPPDAPTGPAAQTQQAPPAGPANKSGSPAPVAPHREKAQHAPAPGGNTALNAEARLQSGANPRTKLTETELAAKMEQMRILNAEKTRKFEKAEQDERSHAEAYARGMEEARKRKQVEAEQRRRGEEERKRMDDERAKNRQRKLKAMSMKEGGWDEGKEALAAEEDRRGFRSANGGIRGARSAAGLSGSKFANEGDDGDRYGDRYDRDDRRGGRGRGRGRGQGRGGRGGRGGDLFEPREPVSNGARDTKTSAPESKAKAPAITTEEFPALPSKGNVGETSPPVLSPLGRWDDEMEAFDARMKSDAKA